MAFTLKDGQGSLFKNDKQGNDARPDMRGDCMIDGVVYEISAWTKLTKGGDRFLSLSVKPKSAQRPKSKPERNAYRDKDDTDFPF